MARNTQRVALIAIFAVLSSFGGSLFLGNSAHATFQTSGLIANWSGSQFISGSNVWTDSINGQSLQPTGGVTTTNTSGMSNVVTTNIDGRGAATFSNAWAVSNYYSITNANFGLATGTVQSESLFMWLKTPNTYNSAIPVLFQSQPSASTWTNWQQFGIGQGGGLFLAAANTSGTVIYSGPPGEYLPNVTSVVTDSKWHNVGFVRYPSGSGEAADLYIDGVKQYTETSATTGISPISLNYICLASSACQWDPYTGSITDLSIWNTALTATDVMNNYLDKVDDFYPPTAITSLSNSSQAANTGVAISNAVPTLASVVTGATSAPTSYSISPALPNGVSLNPTTGVISGAPVDISPTRTYTLTAATNMGVSTTTFTLGVTAIGGVNISFAAPPSATAFRQKATFTATTNAGGTVTFYANNKKMLGCVNVKVAAFSATCDWKPNIRGTVAITAVFTTTDGSTTSSTPITYFNVKPR